MSIRLLTPADVAAFREMRLIAMRESPTAFGSSEEDELARTMDETARRLEPTENDIVLGAQRGGALVGMVGLHRLSHRKERHKAVMWGMYVLAAARGTGLGRALVADLMSRAREMPDLLQVNLAVERENLRALALYRSFGFVPFGVEERALIIEGRSYAEVHMVSMLDGA